MKYNANEFVQRIPSCYVTYDGVQIMIAHFGNTMSILNSDGLVYYCDPNSDFYINNYYNDSRRTLFPYSDTPIHTERVKFRKYEFVNQILDFNKTYIAISDNIIREFYAVKDEDCALVVTKVIVPNCKTTKSFTLEEFDKWVKSFDIGIFSPKGSKEKTYISYEDRILDSYTNYLLDRFPEFLDEDEYNNFKSISNLTIADIPCYRTFDIFNPGIFISTAEEEGQKMPDIKCVNVMFENNRVFSTIATCPVTRYNYEHLKYLEQNSLANTPKPIIRTRKRIN